MHRPTRRPPALIALVAFALAASVHAAPDQHARTGSSLLIRFAPSASAAARGAYQKTYRVEKAQDFGRLVPGLQAWSLPKGANVDQVLAALGNNPDVLYAEPDYVQRADATPNDPRFGELWGLHNTGQNAGVADADIDAPEAWDTATGGTEVVVGVVDTGIDWTHPDLADNIWTNAGEIAGNGVDDDGNGYVDDVHGWNAITSTGNALDDNDHGSHCSGTIGGRGNNGVGVAGVNWNVRLMALKFLDAAGSGSTAGAISAIDYAVAQKGRGVNVRVLSNSWGGGGFSQALLDAINAANAADILFAAAAGNSSSNNDVSPHYPSSYDAPNVLAVAATTRTDAMASFSSYGATSVDLGAPGAEILSTTPGNTYQVFSGTSMATPHVSGAAALMLSVNGTLTTAEVKAYLMQSVDPTPAMNGRCVSGGRLNVASALALAGPPVPTFRMTAAPASATVSQGQTASFTISTSSVNGYAGSVDFSLSSQPALSGATVAFTPDPVAVGASSALSIATTTGTAAGAYALTVTGVSGTITRTVGLTLTVDPEGTVTVSYANPTVFPINDNSSLTSTISVPDSLTIIDTQVTVDITHTYIGDLEVSVISPAGTTVIVHNRAGGSADNIHQTYQLANFNGQNSQGTWQLVVRDLASLDVGTLDNWRVTIKGYGSAPPPPDTTPPSVAITSPANGATVSGNVTITASASDNVGVSEVRFLVDGAVIASDTQAPYSTVWNSASAAPGGHTLTAQATDAAGNATTSVPVSVTVSNDTTAPVISAVAAGSLTRTTAVITWTTNEAADSQVEYGTTTAYGSSSALDPAQVSSHQVPLSGLRKNTLYHYRVRSMDAAGNAAVSGDFTFRTPR